MIVELVSASAGKMARKFEKALWVASSEYGTSSTTFLSSKDPAKIARH